MPFVLHKKPDRFSSYEHIVAEFRNTVGKKTTIETTVDTTLISGISIPDIETLPSSYEGFGNPQRVPANHSLLLNVSNMFWSRLWIFLIFISIYICIQFYQNRTT